MKSRIAASLAQADSAAELRRHLFYETSHSPALADLVGYEKAKDIIDFCFIANPYYPTVEMLDDLQQNLDGAARLGIAGVLHTDAANTRTQLGERFGIGVRTR